MNENKEFQLSGSVSYSVRKKYKWLTEPGACRVCKAMHGKLYEKEDVPKWPHPNCKCHVEEISIIDPTVSEAYNYREEVEQLMLQAQKLTGDTKYLKAQIEKYAQEQQSNELKRESNFLQRKIEELCNELSGFLDWYKDGIKTVTKEIIIQKQKMLNEMKETTAILNKAVYELSINILKWIQDTSVNAFSPLGEDAAALWKLSTTKFQDGLDYVKKNGYIVNDINDLKDKKLIDAVKSKVESQLHKSNSRGVVFREDSSMSALIGNSKEFNDFVEKHIYELCAKDRILDADLSLELYTSGTNAFLSVHKIKVVNIHYENGFIVGNAIDTIDYNAKEPWVIVPRILQEHGMIEGYYHVTKISVPVDRWLDSK